MVPHDQVFHGKALELSLSAASLAPNATLHVTRLPLV